VDSNRDELQHVEPILSRFEGVIGELDGAAERQASLIARKQDASQEFSNLLTEAERLATILLLAIKQHYGIRAEKLAEFGLQPFRGRSGNTQPGPEPEPPAPGPELTTPATTKTDGS
jgi:hypothetical protein